ncbi:DMT family transporter [Ammoniphilus resinae]|uniref:Drug/metabolite transporter (DMT)-like permease n=1 Tax=Ammoniphilus resinae TaxID=861532 RepID=A0ABS4GL75_9BACL|nr:DMT family transporter [Ammoniphilus resinae]MBP1931006.1 drug/metabolite transporter (DMT)-like permease [Ammoniphilus resinae]
MHRAYLFLLLCNLLWAGNIIFGKLVTSELTPLWITFLRWFIAILILVPITQLLERPNWMGILRKHWRPLALMGIFGGILFNGLTYIAITYTSPTNVALISALMPAFIMIFSVLFLHEKVGITQILGLALSFFGVVFILTGGAPYQVFQTQYNLGDLLMLVVGLCWAIYSILAKKLSHVTPLTATTISSCFAVLFMLPFLPFSPVDLVQVTTMGWVGILYIGIFATVGAFVLWNISVCELGASKSSISMNLVPVYTGILTIFLGGQLAVSQVIGGLIVFGGMILTTNLVQFGLVHKKTVRNLHNRVG